MRFASRIAILLFASATILAKCQFLTCIVNFLTKVTMQITVISQVPATQHQQQVKELFCLIQSAYMRQESVALGHFFCDESFRPRYGISNGTHKLTICSACRL